MQDEDGVAAVQARPRRWPRRLLGALLMLILVVTVLNWTWGRLPSEPKPTGHFVQVGALRIHYLETDPHGHGLPVLLIHGLPGTAYDFDAVTPLLSGHRTIALDRPGYGYSTGGYLPFAGQLRAIHGLLARLGISKAIIVGHSYGGTIALGYAERFPSQVAGLVLVDAAAAGDHPNGMDRAQAHLVQVLQAPVVKQVSDVIFSQLVRKLSAEAGDSEAFSPAPVSQGHLHRLLAINMTPGNLAAYASEMLAAKGVIEGIDRRLSDVKVHAVVIQGSSDKLVHPVYGQRLAATLPNARLEMLSGGHMQPYQHPQAIAEAVEAIAGELRSAEGRSRRRAPKRPAAARSHA
jgi:pimeloyl-ACP methyl ester carboxylesterase